MRNVQDETLRLLRSDEVNEVAGGAGAKMSVLQNSANAAIKAIGEGLASVARKS
jgi:hypothetical protein